MERTKRLGEIIPKKKKRILISSAKDKGRRLQKWVCSQISELTRFECGPSGQDYPIESRPMGQSGTDIRMESHVLKAFPFSVECKHQESWSVHSWIEQAKKNELKKTDWLLICKKNNKEPIVIMDAAKFFILLKSKGL